jgi:hypothetical protein
MSTFTTMPSMPTIGGKRKMNKSLKAWITFVKKVQKEEKLSYKDAIHRAKVRKDKGEKWMSGGDGISTGTLSTVPLTTDPSAEPDPSDPSAGPSDPSAEPDPSDPSAGPSDPSAGPSDPSAGPSDPSASAPASGGKRRRRSRTMRRSRKGGRRSRRRASRRH